MSLLSAILQAPSSLKKEYFLRFMKSYKISIIFVIWQNIRTLSPFLFFYLSILSNYLNLEESAIKFPKLITSILVNDGYLYKRPLKLSLNMSV